MPFPSSNDRPLSFLNQLEVVKGHEWTKAPRIKIHQNLKPKQQEVLGMWFLILHNVLSDFLLSACTVCRRLKMKCVGAENGPPCKRCQAGNHECRFEESNRGKRSTKYVHLPLHHCSVFNRPALENMNSSPALCVRLKRL
jgi:Fungal Zn(2)-Cys(6) binuclear cluster domain